VYHLLLLSTAVTYQLKFVLVWSSLNPQNGHIGIVDCD